MAMVWSRIRSGLSLCSFHQTGPVVIRHCQLLCTSATKSMMYFTPSSMDGIEMDPAKASTLHDLFSKSRLLCFENIGSSIGCHDFSAFSKSIFAKVMTVAHRQGDERSRYFQFDPSSILVSYHNNTVLEVGIPVSQLATDDEVDSSIYKDHIVGPFAKMVMSLCLQVVTVNPHKGGPNMNGCYKEILDLLHRAQTGKWWTNLNELLAHPLFQLLEQKIVYLSLAHMWLNGPKPARHQHGVTSVAIPARKKTKLSPTAFQNAYQAFYLKDYTISYVGSEMEVTESSNQQDWRTHFIQNNCFGSHYPLGLPTSAAMVRHCRVIIFHFEDENMEAYAAFLDKPSAQIAIIHLDRTFSLSLSFFYALRSLGVNVECVLDVVPQ